jgi:hypothetical protein
MCRIWIDGVPPGHQPAPTDCETAVRNQPRNSQIIWGDNTNRQVADNHGDHHDRDRDAANHDNNTSGTVVIRTGTRTIQRAWTTIATAGAITTRRCARACTRATCPGNNGGNGGNTGGANVPGDRGFLSVDDAGDDGRSAHSRWRPYRGRAELARSIRRAIGETVDANGDGVPEQATWYDPNGTVLQVWRDEDRDGRADSVRSSVTAERSGNR